MRARRSFRNRKRHSAAPCRSARVRPTLKPLSESGRRSACDRTATRAAEPRRFRLQRDVRSVGTARGVHAVASSDRWATSLYEPSLLGPPIPRTRLETAGVSRPIINLGSYNYLGLATHPETIAAAQEALATYGTGACGSPVLSGMTDLHHRLERRTSGFLGRESTMLFNSGFGGALGSLSGLLRK